MPPMCPRPLHGMLLPLLLLRARTVLHGLEYSKRSRPRRILTSRTPSRRLTCTDTTVLDLLMRVHPLQATHAFLGIQ